MAQTRIEKKITVKTVLGGKPDIKKIIAAHEAGGGALRLIEVYGIANDIKEGETVAPDGKVSGWIKLLGTFMAKNLETGEMIRSGQCIMPGAANDLVSGVLKGGDVRGVEFGFRISALYDDSAATHYVYKVEQLHAVKENDPLEKLAAQLGGAPALPAPVAPAGNGEAKPEPVPTPAAKPEPARPAARR
jgi:hypothetical protein